MRLPERISWPIIVAGLVLGLGLVLVLNGAAASSHGPRSNGTKLTFGPSQVKINQRIARAGVLRANRANHRLDALGSSTAGGAAAVAGPRGPQGPPGPVGPTGPAGPAGPGAARISYDPAATADPHPQTVLALDGLTISATCTTGGGGTTDLGVTLTSAEAATLWGTSTDDSGTDPSSSTTPSISDFQAPLPAGVPISTGGPSAAPGQFSRSIAHVIYVAPSRTISIIVAVEADGIDGRCFFQGTAVPAS